MIKQETLEKVQELKKEIEGILSWIERGISEAELELHAHPEPETYPETLEAIKELLVEAAAGLGMAL